MKHNLNPVFSSNFYSFHLQYYLKVTYKKQTNCSTCEVAVSSHTDGEWLGTSEEGARVFFEQ